MGGGVAARRRRLWWKKLETAARPRKGEDLAGRSILLYGEQGLGDAIQFARYAPPVARRGARVVLYVPPPLVALLRRLPGVTVAASGERLLPRTDWIAAIPPVPGMPIALVMLTSAVCDPIPIGAAAIAAPCIGAPLAPCEPIGCANDDRKPSAKSRSLPGWNSRPANRARKPRRRDRGNRGHDRPAAPHHRAVVLPPES